MNGVCDRWPQIDHRISHQTADSLGVVYYVGCIHNIKSTQYSVPDHYPICGHTTFRLPMTSGPHSRDPTLNDAIMKLCVDMCGINMELHLSPSEQITKSHKIHSGAYVLRDHIGATTWLRSCDPGSHKRHLHFCRSILCVALSGTVMPAHCVGISATILAELFGIYAVCLT